MYLMTNFGDLNKAERQPDGQYKISVWYEPKETWSLLGTYTKTQIDAALIEGTIQECSANKAAKYIRIATQK